MFKIAHLTSAHNRNDTRIFIKMCSSLANHGYDISLVVADGLGDEIKNNVKIIDIGARDGGRYMRMTKTVGKVYKEAKDINADLYHLHDPELLPFISKLKRLGKKVIFDAHEDLPKQILSKPYLNKFTATIISKTIQIYERIVCRNANFIIAATPSIRDKFKTINKNSLDVNNYPLLAELFSEIQWNDKQNEICFIGSISRIRGISEVIHAIEIYKECVLNLVGEFNEDDFRLELELLPGWKNVKYLGYLNRENVKKVIAKSKAGIVTFLPVPNHIDAQPNKMFEYMSAGLPVISSDFPLWKEIVEGNNCGVCVNPLNANEIASAIKFIIDNPVLADEMGKNGRKAIVEKYNWEIEEKKLFQVYEQVLGN